MLLELIAFSVFMLIFVIFLMMNIRLSLKNRKLRKQILQLGIDKVMLLERIEKFAPQTNQVEQTEGFVRFLSQSRDWAFEYIENVQAALQEFEEAMNSKDDSRIEKSLNDLKNFLPKDEEENTKQENEEK
jgi:molecular chaperone DnaK (HSP70)